MQKKATKTFILWKDENHLHKVMWYLQCENTSVCLLLRSTGIQLKQIDEIDDNNDFIDGVAVDVVLVGNIRGSIQSFSRTIVLTKAW